MENQPFLLRKRNRHQEEYSYIPTPVTWSKAIINIEQGTVFGRTPYRWLLLFLFYALFYSTTALLFLSCYWVFNRTLTTEGPKYRLPQPGLNFEPALQSHTQDFQRIVYNEHSEEQIAWYVDRIEMTLMKYGAVPLMHFGDCRPENEYGYRTRRPCFFLRINRIVGFRSQTIQTVEELPQKSPQELRTYLQTLSPMERKHRIWVSCETRPFTQLHYYPQRYFNTSYVDVVRTIQHQPPEERIQLYGRENARFYNESDFHRLIAVKLEGLRPNQVYRVKCFLCAMNIDRDVAVVQFAVEIRSNTSK